MLFLREGQTPPSPSIATTVAIASPSAAREVRMHKVAAFLFGYIGPRRKELSAITWDDVDYRKGR